MAEEAPRIETIDFDGDNYAIESLTPRVIEGFNMLVRLQQDVQGQAYELKKSQAAQVSVSEELKAMIKEDKIKSNIDIVDDTNDTSAAGT
jgi:hypothetical protein